jgi:cytoskeletal protein CcmA (bactofilin family)
MRKILPLILAVLTIALLIPSPVYASSNMDDKVVMGGSFVLNTGETLDGKLIVIGGTATVEEGATVKGDVILLGGQLSIRGTINGSMSLFGGAASLHETAVVDGDVRVTSSVLNKDDNATVKGKVIQGSNLPDGFIIPENATPKPTNNSIDTSPIFKFLTTSLHIIFISIGSAILALVLALFFAKPMQRTVDAIVENPLLAIGTGLLTAIAAPIAIILIAVTFILVPVSVLAVILLAVAMIMGWITIGMELGNRIAGLFKTKWPAAVSAGLGTLLLTLTMEIIGLIPCLGWSLIFVVAIIGLGGVILTRGGTHIVEHPSTTPPTGGINTTNSGEIPS